MPPICYTHISYRRHGIKTIAYRREKERRRWTQADQRRSSVDHSPACWACNQRTHHGHSLSHNACVYYIIRPHHRQANQSGFTGAKDSKWQWHQLGHMQICISPQTDNYASTPTHRFLHAFLPRKKQHTNLDLNYTLVQH